MLETSSRDRNLFFFENDSIFMQIKAGRKLLIFFMVVINISFRKVSILFFQQQKDGEFVFVMHTFFKVYAWTTEYR